MATQYAMQQDGQSWNLSEVTEEKDLGVIVSSDLKVSRQCSGVARKASIPTCSDLSRDISQDWIR